VRTSDPTLVRFTQKQSNNDVCAFMYPPEDDLYKPKHVVTCVIKQNIDKLISVYLLIFVLTATQIPLGKAEGSDLKKTQNIPPK
jgi:hypothetical protein